MNDLAINDCLVFIHDNAAAAISNLVLLRAVSRPRVALATDAPPPDPAPIRHALKVNVGNVLANAQQLAALLKPTPPPDGTPNGRLQIAE